MKTIPLTKNMVAIVDDEDFERLNQYSWRVHGRNGYFYASTGTSPNLVLMHREILNAGPSLKVDHRDGNGLNNSRSNLRTCTHAQNMQNRIKHTKSKSKFKGVHSEIQRGQLRWRAQVRANGKKYGSGRYMTEEQAAVVYDALARQHHGEFARLNFA